MMRLLPHLCRIKYKWDSLNSTNNSQKSEFQDKGGEESDKIEKNIPEALAGNRTAVVIKVRNEAIKGGGEVKERGSEKKGEKEKKEEKSTRERERERESKDNTTGMWELSMVISNLKL